MRYLALLLLAACADAPCPCSDRGVSVELSKHSWMTCSETHDVEPDGGLVYHRDVCEWRYNQASGLSD